MTTHHPIGPGLIALGTCWAMPIGGLATEALFGAKPGPLDPFVVRDLLCSQSPRHPAPTRHARRRVAFVLGTSLIQDASVDPGYVLQNGQPLDGRAAFDGPK
jgi:hypothetical protein